MTLQNKIKTDVFVCTTIFFMFLAIAGFLLAFGKSEGTLSNGVLVNALEDIIICIFPFAFISKFVDQNNFIVFLLSIILNVVGYSLLAVSLFSKRLLALERYRPFLLTYYITMVILSFLLLSVIVLIMTST